MPLSTSLPAPSIEFYSDLIFPEAGAALRSGDSLNFTNQSKSRPGTQQAVTPVAAIGFFTSGGVVGPDFEQVGGRTCCFVSSTTGFQSNGFKPETWQPGYDAAGFNPGAYYDPGSVVAIIDFHVAATSALFTGTLPDTTGFWFIPRFDLFTQPSIAAASPGSGFPNEIDGGFGIAMNDDGAGNNRWEFVSFTGAPVILAREIIPASSVPDVTAWSTFRFTIVGAASGRPASLSLEANGVPVDGVQGLEFDDVTLMRPNTLQALSLGFYFGQALGPMDGEGYRFRVYARFGRFTASGAEMQAV